jgi:hypothetical protein
MILIKNKRVLKDASGEDYIDLIGTVYKPTDGTPIINFIIVDEELEGRADKISIRAYGTHRNSDILMRFNSISNPFGIMVGDIILIPDITVAENRVKKVPNLNKIKENILNKIQNNTDKLPKVDEKRIERLKKLASKFPNASKNFDSPNRLEDGETNITRNDGLIFFS